MARGGFASPSGIDAAGVSSLTPEGKEAFALLDARSREEVAEMLDGLSKEGRRRLLEAMHAIEGALDEAKGGFKYSEPFCLRRHESGDMGWVVPRHEEL